MLALMLFALPAHATAEEKGIKNIIGDVSDFLSSTNPVSTKPSGSIAIPTKPFVAKPTAPIAVISPNRQSPKLLPTVEDVLSKNNQQVLLPEPPIDAYEEQLAPKTKQMLDKIPRGVGAEKKSPKQQVKIKRGYFDNVVLDKSGEEVAKPENPNMDIKMSKKAPPEDAIKQLDNALKALTVGQYEAAISLYKSVLKRNKKSHDALFGLATAYQKSGQKQQARAAYSDLFKQYPNDEAGLNNFLVLVANEAPQQALRELDILSERSPDFASIYAQKSVIYNRMNDKERAIQNMARAFRLAPANTTYKYNLAVLLDDAGQREDAARIYRDLISQNYDGTALPVGRQDIMERLNYISGEARSNSTTAN